MKRLFLLFLGLSGQALADALPNLSVAALGSQVCNTPLTFYWNDSALQQQGFDATQGFSFECDIALNSDAGDKVLAIGLSPNPVNTTSNVFQFSSGGVSSSGFAGATLLILMNVNQSGVTCRQLLPAPQGTTSPTVSTLTSTQNVTGQTGHLWLTCTPNTTSSSQTISIGFGAAPGTNQLFSWSTSTAQGRLAKIAVGTGGSPLTYANIKIGAYTVAPATDNTNAAPVTTAPATTDAAAASAVTTSTITAPAAPNTINATASSPLAYSWTIGQTTSNPQATLDPNGGGYLTALCTITKLVDPLHPAATIVVGFSANPASSDAYHDANGNALFAGAQYNIQFAAANGTGNIYVIKPTSSARDFTGIGSVPALNGLTSGTSFSTHKLWVRYLPTANGRQFTAGILPASSNDDITSSAVTPQWTWTDSTTSGAPGLTAASICSWGTNCTLSQITVVATPPSTTTQNASSASNSAVVTYDGTLGSNNIPSDSQWATSPWSIKTATTGRLSIAGTAQSRAVLAFCASQTTFGTLLLRALIDANGITLLDANNTTLAKSATPATGGITTAATTYWIRFTGGAFSMGTITGSNALPSAPIVEWTSATLSGVSPVYFTYGATSGATVSYLGSSIDAQSTLTSAPAATVNRYARNAAPASANSSNASNNSQQASSDALDLQLYRANSRVRAR